MNQLTIPEIIGEDGLFTDGDWVESKDQDPNGDVRLLQLADIGDGIFLNKSNRRLTGKKANELRCTFLKRGDILIARMPEPLGRSCIYPGLEEECVTVVDVCIIRISNPNYHNLFLSKLINSAEIRKSIDKQSTGTTRIRISRGNLSKIAIDIPPLSDQKRIAHLLGKVEGLIAERKQHLQQLDDLLKSVFLEMFGDPVKNEKGWDKSQLKYFGKILTGNTPPRKDSNNYSSEYLEWIKTDNIEPSSVYVSKSKEHLSEAGETKARLVSQGALLVACIAGSISSIGRAALTDRTIAFNQQINALQPNEDINSFYIYTLFKICKRYIQSHASKGMKKILNKGDFEKIEMIKPPIMLQDEFAVVFKKVDKLKSLYQQSLNNLEQLYPALSQKAFKGELDLSLITLDSDEILDETAKELELTVEPQEIKLSAESAETVFSISDRAAFLSNKLQLAIKESEGEVSAQTLLENLNLPDFKYEGEAAAETLEDYELLKKLLFESIQNGEIEQSYQEGDDSGNHQKAKRVVLTH